MSKHLRKAVAFILSLLTVFAAPFAQTVTAVDNNISNLLGGVWYERSEKLSDALYYNEYYGGVSVPQHAFAIEYSKSDIAKMKTFSTGNVGLDSYLTTIDKNKLSIYSSSPNYVWSGSTQNYDVLAAVGTSGLAPFIVDGQLMSSPAGSVALGFDAYGTAVVGDPGFHLLFGTSGVAAYSEIRYFNTKANYDGLALYTTDYGTTVNMDFPCTFYYIQITDNSVIKPQGTFTGVVKNVGTTGSYNPFNPYNPYPGGPSATSAPIYPGYALLVIPTYYSSTFSGSTLTADAIVYFQTYVATEWASVTTAFTGTDVLISAGTPVTSPVYGSTSSTAAANPTAATSRLAIGTRYNGSVVIFGADGGKTDANGITRAELISIMQAYGCTNAITLSAGSAVSFAARTGSDKYAAVRNNATGGAETPVSTAIVFYSTGYTSNTMGSLRLSPSSPLVLAGSSVNFDALVYDVYYQYNRTLDDSAATFSSTGGIGTFSGAVFNASKTLNTVAAGTVTATASSYASALSGSTPVTVTPTLTSLKVTPVDNTGSPIASSRLSIKAGSSQQLVFDAEYKNVDVLTSPEAFTLTCSPESTYISIGSDGKLNVGSGAANGDYTLTITGGGKSATLLLTVTGGFTEEVITVDTSKSVQHDFENSKALSVFTPKMGLGASLSYQQFLTHGYRSTGSMQLKYTLPANSYASLNYTVTVPAPHTALGLQMWVYGLGDDDAQLCTTLRLTDGTTKDISYKKPVGEEYTYSGWQLLFAPFPSDHSVSSIIAPIKIVSDRDTYSNQIIYVDNIALYYTPYKSADTPAEPVFADSSSSWAKDYIEEMYALGYAEGSVDGNGKRYYYPNNNLTRQEFAKMLVTVLDIKIANSAGVSFAFTDRDEIASWAQPYVRAAAAAGLMNGRQNADGTISFAPNAPITRQEVMTVFGRLLPAKMTNLTFSDKGDIADWAYDNVVSTVANGVITGYEDNTIRPLGYITRAEIAAIFIRSMDLLTY